MNDSDINRMAASFAELVETREQALELARLVAAEINAAREPLQRRVAWLEELLAGHQATALLRRFDTSR